MIGVSKVFAFACCAVAADFAAESSIVRDSDLACQEVIRRFPWLSKRLALPAPLATHNPGIVGTGLQIGLDLHLAPPPFRARP